MRLVEGGLVTYHYVDTAENITMTINVARWGNSLAVRLPKHVVESAGLAEGAAVNVTVSKDGTILLRSAKPEYTLQQLLEGVTKENVHAETDSGKPVGKEFW